VSRSSPRCLADLLEDADAVVEVGIGHRTDLSETLLEAGVSVTATDIEFRETPSGVEFVVDDVTDPDVDLYADADALVAQNLPPDLQRPVYRLATAVEADFLFTTLGADPSIVPAEPISFESETVFVARAGSSGTGNWRVV
jgi:hypothetical protein